MADEFVARKGLISNDLIRAGNTSDTTEGNMRWTGTDLEVRKSSTWESLTNSEVIFLSGETIDAGTCTTNSNDSVFHSHLDGTNGSTTFTDESSSAHTITPSGDAQVSTAQSKFGGASLLLDGTGDYLQSPTSSDFEFAGDYTVECWVNVSGVPGSFTTIMGAVSGSGEGWGDITWVIFLRNTGLVSAQVSDNGSPGITLDATTNINGAGWTHIALVRNGSNTDLYINGTSEASTTSSYTVQNNTHPLWIGHGYSTSQYFNGYIDEPRILDGTAAWTTDFSGSLPTLPYCPVGASVGAGDPAYFDGSQWKKATVSTERPTGLATSVSGEIVLSGKVTGLSGLTAGEEYYLGTSGGLTTTSTETNIFIGTALSVTELQVDIDVIPSASAIDGTGTNTQLAYFTDSNTLASTSQLVWNGTLLDVTGAILCDDSLTVSGSTNQALYMTSTGGYCIQQMNGSSATYFDFISAGDTFRISQGGTVWRLDGTFDGDFGDGQCNYLYFQDLADNAGNFYINVEFDDLNLIGRKQTSGEWINYDAGTDTLTLSPGTIDLPNTGVTAASYTNADITVDADGRITAASNGTAGSGSSLPASVILNGAMAADKDNQGATYNPSAGTVSTLDMYTYYDFLTTGAMTVQRVTASNTVTDEDFRHYMEIVNTTTSTIGASEYAGTGYAIEGQDFAPIAHNSTGKMSIGFWVNSSVTGLRSISVRNAGVNRSFVVDYTINSANTWQYIQIDDQAGADAAAIDIATGIGSGTWNYDTGVGLYLFFADAVGSTYHGGFGPGTWRSANYLSSSSQPNYHGAAYSMRITGLRVRAGDDAGGFDHKTIQEDLLSTERYRKNLNNTGGNRPYWYDYHGTPGQNWFMNLDVGEMRAIPTITSTIVSNGSTPAVSCTQAGNLLCTCGSAAAATYFYFTQLKLNAQLS